MKLLHYYGISERIFLYLIKGVFLFMWSRKELKTNAKAALKNYWGKAILAIILTGAIASAGVTVFYILAIIFGVFGSYEDIVNIQNGSVSAEVSTNNMTEGAFIILMVLYVLLIVFMFLVCIPISVGLYRFFQKSRGVPTPVTEIFVPLKKFAHIAGAMLLMNVKVWLWSLLFVIPGIIKAYEYHMVPFILAENPEISTKRAFQISKAMTSGHKWDLFVLELSFILWAIGASCTCGILYLYLAPYMQATFTEAYYKLKAEAVAKGEVNLMELPDICIPTQPPVPPVPPTAPTAM